MALVPQYSRLGTLGLPAERLRDRSGARRHALNSVGSVLAPADSIMRYYRLLAQLAVVPG